MGAIKLVVIGDPAAGHMRLLDRLPGQPEIIISDRFEHLKTAARDAGVLLNGGFHNGLFRDVFPFAERVRWVHNMQTGMEHILTPELVSSPVPVTNARGVFKSSLAEFVAAAILCFAKDLRRMFRNQEAGVWSQFDTTEVKGQTLGVIGYGEIGRESARLARALGMRVIAARRRSPDATGDLLAASYSLDRLHDMLAASDYLLLAAPLTPETRGLIGVRELAALKPGAVVINVGRGAVVVESALIHALETKRIKGAALDVFETEPLPDGHPFYRLENVLLSPHAADHTPGWIELAMNKFIDNFRHFQKGEPLENVVDKQAGY